MHDAESADIWKKGVTGLREPCPNGKPRAIPRRARASVPKEQIPLKIRFAALALAVLIAAALGVDAQRPTPDAEMRGLWVARWSLKSPAAVRNIVRNAKSHNFNTLFVQVRGRGDAWYVSDNEPRAEMLEDAPPGFDPLALIVKEAHARGIEVHAWVNTYLTWTGSKKPKSRSHIVNAHPDWIARDNKGRSTMKPSEHMEGLYVQPSNPKVQEHLHRVFTDIARRYDIDGIHFDYVRYPNPTYDFAPDTLARFEAYMRPKLTDAGRAGIRKDGTRLAYVHMFPNEWAEWRRLQVTSLVKRISDSVHEMKPWVKVSAAVFANAEDAYKDKGQDWRAWLAHGYLDAICPMSYSKNTETVARQIQSAIEAAGEKHVYAGIGSWRISAEDTAQKISRVRKLGVQGVNIYSYDGITRDGKRKDYLDALTRSSFASRAGVPGMRWRGSKK